MSDRSDELSGPPPGAVTRADAASRRWPGGGRAVPAMPPVDHVLAVYGTLRPGRSNFGVVADVAGEWYAGTIRGRLGTRRTGHYRGFPAFVVDPEGPDVPVSVLVSADLPNHWDRLDAFEGPGYCRVEIDVRADVASGAPVPLLRAFVYESIE